MTVTRNAQAALDELRSLVNAIDETQLDTAARVLAQAPRIFFTGAGRSGLSARATAMRLMHIGKQSYVVGETATPAVEHGDVLVVVTSSGRGCVLEHATLARTVGASVVVFSSRENDATALSDVSVIVPARSVVPTQQYAGSLFEQGCLIVGDAICRSVQSLLNVPDSALDARHANIA